MFKLLSPDGVLGRWLAFLLDALLISVVWAVCCVPVVTAGAATAALCRVALDWMRYRDGCTLRAFLRAMKADFKKATCVWLVLLAFLIPLIADLYLLWGTDIALPEALLWISLALALVWLAWAGYAFMLEAVFDNPARRTLGNALRFIIGRIGNTVAVLLIDAAALVLTFLLPVAAFVFLPAAVFLSARIYWRAFLPLIPPEELRRWQGEDGEEEDDDIDKNGGMDDGVGGDVDDISEEK